MTRLAGVLMVVVFVSVSGCRGHARCSGKVVAVEQGGGGLQVQDEDARDRPPLPLDIRTAEIGVTPRIGDRVRTWTKAGPASNRALRVMNLSQHQSDK